MIAEGRIPLRTSKDLGILLFIIHCNLTME